MPRPTQSSRSHATRCGTAWRPGRSPNSTSTPMSSSDGSSTSSASPHRADEQGGDDMTWPPITIGFVARERFVLAGEALASLYEHTPLPFSLLVVDAGTPKRFMNEMQNVLDAHTNWRVLHHDGPLLPAAAKNLVLAELDAGTEFVCLLENDNLFTD